MMAVILAYGDSNTWGFDPAGGARFDAATRWTGVMARELGPTHQVIEEGLRGRTTVFEDPIEPGRNGAAYLTPCLLSHEPLDLVIIALGCNDLKKRYSLSATDIADGAEKLVLIARGLAVAPGAKPPAIILAAPPPLARLSEYSEIFEGAAPTSKRLGERYRAVAERNSVGYVDCGQFIHCSDLDGIHFEASQHAILGKVMAEAVRMMLLL
jgi:lysophospholipase L1-like esterase